MQEVEDLVQNTEVCAPGILGRAGFIKSYLPFSAEALLTIVPKDYIATSA